MTRFLALLFVLCGAAVPLAASAGELDLSGSLSGFTSPNQVYGPWRDVQAGYRAQIGRDKPGIFLVDRADADRLDPTHSLGVSIDDYHDFSSRFFAYGTVGVSSGRVLATREAYLEGDVKLGRAMTTVFGLGAGTVANPDGVVQNYINLGPSVYYNGGSVTFRWLPSFTTGRGGTSTGILTWEAGIEGKSTSIVTLLAGSQPPNGIASATESTTFGQRALLAGYTYKHWTSPKGGFFGTVEVEKLNDRTSGDLLYVRRGINVGIFRILGRDVPSPVR